MKNALPISLHRTCSVKNSPTVRCGMLCIVVVVLFLLSSPQVQAADKFWIASAPGNFSDDANWSLSSGGAGGAGVPGSGETAKFDGNGLGNCTIDANANVAGITIDATYTGFPATGTITQGPGITLTVGSSGFILAGGTFVGSSGNIDINASGFAACLNLSGGTFMASTSTTFAERFRRNSGTFIANNGTFVLDGSNTVDDGLNGVTFNNLTVNRTSGATSFLNGSPTIIGTLTLNAGQVCLGTLNAQGDVLVGNTFDGGCASVTFSGGVNQTFTNNGGSNPSGNWNIDKSAGRVTLASNLILGTSQGFNITQGTLDQGASFDLAAGLVRIGNGILVGRLTNQGTGDLTLGGNLVVDTGSTISLNGGGGGCADADSIVIRSSVNGTQRTWSGGGNFFLTDVDVKDQATGIPPGSINVFEGTDSGNNTGFSAVSSCNPTAADSTINGRIVDANSNAIEGAVVRLSGTQNRLTITDAQGDYHFDNVETNGFYTVAPVRVNFLFSPSQRSFSQLGQHNEATFTGLANSAGLNPLDTTEYFVRQQYLDFLSREPDEGGFGYWVNNIESCGNDSGCRNVKRIDTSAAFFLSIEFQQTGYLVYRTYQSAYGDLPNAPVPVRLSEFGPDTQAIGKDVIVNRGNWEQKLERNKQAFMTEFVQRARFVAAYPDTLSPAPFVDQLFANGGVTPSDSDRAAAINEFSSANTTADVAARGRALRRVAENSTLAQQEFNRAFVLMEYFGYLGRDPNSGSDTDFSGYNFWLAKLNAFGGNFRDAEMVKAFLVSTEYRRRFPR